MGSGTVISCTVRLNSILTPQQRELYQRDDVIRRILRDYRTVAIVGLSSDRQKASFFVANYLKGFGYHIIPVNPSAQEILGERCYPDLAGIPDPVDVVDVFRPAVECPTIVNQAIRIGAKAVWMQLRIINLEAAEAARAAGLDVIIDRCMKMEHGRYNGGLHEAGFNTEIITAKRATR